MSYWHREHKHCWMKQRRWSPKVPEHQKPRRREAVVRVLILRPEHQAAGLIAACHQRGLEPIPLATLAIERCPSASSPPSQGLAVFTSVNAVRHADCLGPLPWQGVQAIGIGMATHAALLQTGQHMARPPVPPYTSESLTRQLLDEPMEAMQSGVSLITGENGRTLLVDTLGDADIDVRCLTVYRRTLPEHTAEYIKHALEPIPSIILVPSNQALDNLLLLAPSMVADLCNCPLIVNSERAKEHARHCGFIGTIEVACASGDDGQLQTLDTWIRKHHDA